MYRDFSDSTSYTPAQLNGDITASARAADEAARRGILVVNAMGNFGPARETLWSPADADSIIAVGAVDSLAVVAGFSSRGPTEDGRLKPELSALGVNVPAAAYNTLTGYNSASGTSLATPFVAGIAAMFMQAWPNLTIMAVRNALLLSGSRASAPDNDVGYGVPDISSAILFPEGLFANGVTSLRVGTNELTTIQPTFTWSAPLVNQQMRPVHYRLEIATDAAFSTIIYSDSTDNTSLTVKQPLRPDTIYWRVVAQAFPNVVRVATAPGNFVEPDWVKLLTLNDTHTVETDSLQPLFRWEPLAADAPSGPLTYDVEILNAQTGSVVQRMRNLSTASIRATDQLTPNVTYTWRVIAHSQIATIADTVPALGNFVVVSTQAPPVTLLYQNFPNPFPRHDLGVTSTAVWFDVNTRTKVALAVYDLRGRLVRQLIPNATACPDVVLDPGQYGRLTETIPCVSTSWDGTDMTGTTVPRGVYILRLRAGGADQVKKILFTP